MYCVYGDAKDVDKYVDNIVARYGRKKVAIRRVDLAICTSYQMKGIVHSYAFTILTDREKQLIIKALERGYISSRRRISLEELAESLNIAKPTASLILRKAIEKVLKRLVVTDSM